MNQWNIKSIIFDLGGVLLKVDYQATINAFRNLGLAEPEMSFSKQIQSDVFQKFEKGLISTAHFLNYLKSETLCADESLIIEAWCALIGSFPQARFEMLARLSTNYELYILSNTNKIHQDRFEEHIHTRYGWTNFNSLFNKIYYSHEIGMRKPEKEIYEFVLKSNGMKPAETLFLDDNGINLIAAKDLGIKTVEVGGDDEVTDLLLDY